MKNSLLNLVIGLLAGFLAAYFIVLRGLQPSPWRPELREPPSSARSGGGKQPSPPVPRPYRFYDVPAEMIEAVREPAAERVVRVPQDVASIQQAVDSGAAPLIVIAPGVYIGDIKLRSGVTLCAAKLGDTTIRGRVELADHTRLVNLVIEIGPNMPAVTCSQMDDIRFRVEREAREAREFPSPTKAARQTARTNTTESLWNAALTLKPGTAELQDVQVLFCRFKGAATERDNCIYGVTNIRNLRVVGCLFSYADMTSSGEMYGVHLFNCHDLLFAANTIADIGKKGRGNMAGLVADRCSGVVRNNVITDAGEFMWDSGYGIWVRQPTGLEIAFNTVNRVSSTEWDSTFGICVTGQGAVSVTRNLVDGISGAGWTAPVYGISSEAAEARVTDNAVGDVSAARSARTDVPMVFLYSGVGGAKNAEIKPQYKHGSFHLAGPAALLDDGKETVGVFGGTKVQVTVPAEAATDTTCHCFRIRPEPH